jgi:hypothetical protein
MASGVLLSYKTPGSSAIFFFHVEIFHIGSAFLTADGEDIFRNSDFLYGRSVGIVRSWTKATGLVR